MISGTGQGQDWYPRRKIRLTGHGTTRTTSHLALRIEYLNSPCSMLNESQSRGAVVLSVLRPYRLHPLRYSRLTNLLASSKFVNLRLGPSHNKRYRVRSSRSLTRRATLPNKTDSASGPAQSKLAQAALPPLQALIHSR